MSGETVKVAVEVELAPFRTVTVFAPLAESVAVHEYSCAYGAAVSVAPSLPNTAGNTTSAIPDWASALIELSVKEPSCEPCGL